MSKSFDLEAGEEFVDHLVKLLEEDEHHTADTSVVAEDGTCSAHSFVLSLFITNFESVIERSSDGRIEIKLSDCKVNDVKKILKFIYTGNMSLLTPDDVPLLIKFCNRFEVVSLRKFISESLEGDITKENLPFILSIAKQYNAIEVLVSCLSFMHEENDEMRERIYSEFSVEEVMKMLECDEFALPESLIFEFLLEFSKRCCKESGKKDEVGESEIKEFMRRFLPGIRLPLMNDTYVAEHIHTLGLFSDEELLDAYNFSACGYKLKDKAVDEIPKKYRRRNMMCRFTFDPLTKGSHIELSNGMLSARKAPSSTSSYETVVGTKGFSRGRHYWEVVIDSYMDSEDIWIGVCTKPINCDMNSPPLEGNMWSFLCSYGNRCHRSRNNFYHAVTGNGERIGVLLDVDSHSLTYYHNDDLIGVAFDNLPQNVEFFAAVNLYYDSAAVTLQFPPKPST